MSDLNSVEHVRWEVLANVDEPLPIRILEARIVRHDIPYRHVAVEICRAPRNAVVVASRDDEVLLVLSSRPVVERMMWEFPRGFGEPADGRPDTVNTAIQTARRELWEECGLKGGPACVVGAVHPDSGLLRELVNVVQIQGPWSSHAPEGVGEIESQRWVTRDALRREILRGEITDSFTLSAFVLTDILTDSAGIERRDG